MSALPAPALEHVADLVVLVDRAIEIGDTDKGLRWLAESLFVGSGARRPDRVEMSFFRVL